MSEFDPIAVRGGSGRRGRGGRGASAHDPSRRLAPALHTRRRVGAQDRGCLPRREEVGGAVVPRPKTVEDVQELTLDELLIWLAAMYGDRLKKAGECLPGRRAMRRYSNAQSGSPRTNECGASLRNTFRGVGRPQRPLTARAREEQLGASREPQNELATPWRRRGRSGRHPVRCRPAPMHERLRTGPLLQARIALVSRERRPELVRRLRLRA